MAAAILSPHPDDAVLSLWHLLGGAGEVSVLTVFNGPPEGRREPGWWDRLTRADDAGQRARERAAEDREALGLAGRRPIELGFVDGQYRDREQALEPLIEAVAAAAPGEALVLAPAALDRHRDHLAVRDAALALRGRGRAVALYADIPHATLYGWPAWVSGGQTDPHLDPEAYWDLALEGSGVSLRALSAEVRALDRAQEARKREAVGRYRTQVPALEMQFGLFARPEVLRYEVVWPLPPRLTAPT
jgi:LmbE family N-acetylglucosaminyl deacetylase